MNEHLAHVIADLNRALILARSKADPEDYESIQKAIGLTDRQRRNGFIVADLPRISRSGSHRRANSTRLANSPYERLLMRGHRTLLLIEAFLHTLGALRDMRHEL